jgi:ribonucleoside-diphosphate reductase beta chain
MSVLNTTNSDHTKAKMFLDSNEGIGMQRYDVLKYKSFDKLTDKQLGFFWRPEEIDVLRDAADFKGLTEHEQHIFTSNLKRQILLDSVQGRSPNLALLPLVTIPELETWIETWAFSETIHSRSYTHIIRNVYANPSKIFDEMMDIQEIMDCATDISKYYDDVIEDTQWYSLLGEGTHTVNDKKVIVDLYELKKKLYLMLNECKHT